MFTSTKLTKQQRQSNYVAIQLPKLMQLILVVLKFLLLKHKISSNGRADSLLRIVDAHLLELKSK